MTALDIDVHDPEEYEGKIVHWIGRDYRLGKYVGSGASKIVHTLINQKSGLHHHVAKIWRDVERAREFDERRTLQGISALFGEMLPYATQLFGHGGCIEIMVYIGPYQAGPSGTDDLMTEADEALKNSDFAKARALYERVLEINPYHSVAMNNCAAALAYGGDVGTAMSMAMRAVAVEPNYPGYYHHLFKLALDGGFLHAGATKFQDLISRFHPSETDYMFGVELYLTAGAPERARDLHERCAAHWNRKMDIASWSRIDAALLAKRQAMAEFDKAEALVRASPEDAVPREDVIALLSKGLDAYDREPLIHINLGLQFLHTGQLQAARKHLLAVAFVVEPTMYDFCVANAALAAIQEEAIEEALDLFRALSHFDDLEPVDMPTLGTWVSRRVALSEAAASSSQILETAIADLRRQSQPVPGDLLLIADRYKKASVVLDRPVLQTHSITTAEDDETHP